MLTEIKQKFDAAVAQLHAEGIDVDVLSEDRDASHNAAVGGAKNSQHLHGKAIDLKIANLTDAQKQRALEVFREYGAKGFGIYTRGNVSTGSVHIDFRDGAAAIWGKDGSYHAASGNWMPSWAATALNGLKSDTNPSKQPGSKQPDDNDEQNKEMDPISMLIVALLQAIFPGSRNASPETGQNSDVASLGNLPKQNFTVVKARQTTIS